MPEKLDWSKPLRTKHGWKAELLCVLNHGHYPCIVKMTESNGDERITSHTPDGRQWLNAENDFDLINVPETTTKTVWLKLWNTGAVSVGDGPEHHLKSIIATKRIEVTFTHGVYED